MPTYRISASASGSAVVEVQAADEVKAVQKAYDEHLTGIIFSGGYAEWEIEHVQEVEYPHVDPKAAK